MNLKERKHYLLALKVFAQLFYKMIKASHRQRRFRKGQSTMYAKRWILLFIITNIATAEGATFTKPLSSAGRSCSQLWPAVSGSLFAATLLWGDPSLAQTPVPLGPSTQASVGPGELSYTGAGKIQMQVCSLPGPYLNTADSISRRLKGAGTLFAPVRREVQSGADIFRDLRNGQCQIGIVPFGVLESEDQKAQLPIRPYKVISEIRRPNLNFMCHRNLNVQTLRDFTNNEDIPRFVYVDAKDMNAAEVLESLKTYREEFRPLIIKSVRGSAEDGRENILTVVSATNGCGAWLSEAPDTFLTSRADTLFEDFHLIELYLLGTAGKEVYGGNSFFEWTRYSELVPGQRQLYQRLRQANPFAPDALNMRDERNSSTVIVPVVIASHEMWLRQLTRKLQLPEHANDLILWNEALESAKKAERPILLEDEE